MTSQPATKPGRALHITMWVIAFLAARLTYEQVGVWWSIAVFLGVMLIYAAVWGASQETKKPS